MGRYGKEDREEERKRMKIEQNTKLDDSARVCPRESRGFPER